MAHSSPTKKVKRYRLYSTTYYSVNSLCVMQVNMLHCCGCIYVCMLWRYGVNEEHLYVLSEVLIYAVLCELALSGIPEDYTIC